MSGLASVLETVWHTPTVQKVYRRLPDDHVLDAGYVSRGSKGSGVLHDFAAEDVPGGCAKIVARARAGDHRGGRISVRGSVSHAVRGRKRSVGQHTGVSENQNVEYRTTKIFGPCPYTGGGVSLS